MRHPPKEGCTASQPCGKACPIVPSSSKAERIKKERGQTETFLSFSVKSQSRRHINIKVEE
jgi:hypothetical protein